MFKKILQNYSRAVTMIELLVVVLIIGILATVATGVYTGEARRARIAATQDQIRQLEVAITRYEVDTGTLPPSGSGNGLNPQQNQQGGAVNRINGSGYLHVALVYSMSGSANRPASPLWRGPYINFQANQVGAEFSQNASDPGMLNILDSWGGPIFYVNHFDYLSSSGNFRGGTVLFSGTRPAGANPSLPAPNPYLSLGETFYNTNTYQLISFGPNGRTMGTQTGSSYAGTEEDDITNFGY